MSENESPEPYRPKRIENPEEELRRMAEEQGVTETATFEYMSGAGVGLWESDEEFEEWIRLLAQIRSEKV